MVRDIANTEHFAGIPMKPLLDDSDVNIDDVAGLQDFPVARMPWQTTWLMEVHIDLGNPL